MPRVRPPGIAITDRDISVLSFLGDLALADSRCIHSRFWANATLRSCQARLQRYEEHGLVRSLALAVARYRHDLRGPRGGLLPLLYSLTPDGAALVKSHTGIMPKRYMRSELKPMTALHRRNIVRVRLHMDDSASELGLESPFCIHEEDTRSDVTPETPPVARRVLFHQLTYRRDRVTCKPDLFSVIVLPHRSQRMTYLCYFEIDRGTMRHADLTKKLPGYDALREHRAWDRYLPDAVQRNGDARLRVLWVTDTTERAGNIRKTFENDPRARIFRYTSFERLGRSNIFSDPVWIDPDGNDRSFLPRS